MHNVKFSFIPSLRANNIAVMTTKIIMIWSYLESPDGDVLPAQSLRQLIARLNEVIMHESSEGLSSIYNSPIAQGIPSSACSGTPKPVKSAKVNQKNIVQNAEPPRCLALRTRDGRLKANKISFVLEDLSLPTSVAHGYGCIDNMVILYCKSGQQ